MESALGWGFLHHTHAVALPKSGSESVFFPLLAWFGARRERRVHRTCVIPRGATLVVLLHRRGHIATSSPTMFRRGRNPVIGLQGPGGLWSRRGSPPHRGSAGTTTSTTFTRERFPLNGLHTGMLPISIRYLHRHSIGLGFGHRVGKENLLFSTPSPNTFM